MRAIPWYRSPVFAGVLASIVAQLLELAGIDNVGPDQLQRIIEGLLGVVSIGALGIAAIARKRSPLQPLTLTKAKAEQHNAKSV